MSRYELDTFLTTINAAVPRVLPMIWKFPPAKWTELYDVYVALNPGITVYLLSWFLLFGQYILSILTRSYAWNDRLWSLVPPFYAILFALHPVLSQDRATSGLPDGRLSLMTTLAILWGVRLTSNAWKRGVYYPGSCDHRYTYVRNRTRWIFFVPLYTLSVTYCSILLTLVTAPLYIAWLSRGGAITPLDVIATISCVASLAAQSVADAYQLAFHKRKSKGIATGFCTEGPFKFCRHPAYTAEMSFWASFYLFAISASGMRLIWPGFGVFAYLFLFVFISVPLTERISGEKYSQYSKYQRCVPSLFPIPTRWQRKMTDTNEREKKE